MKPAGVPHTPEKVCWCGGVLTESPHPAYGKCVRCGTLVLTAEVGAEHLHEFYTLDRYWKDHVPNISGYPNIEQRARDDFAARIPKWFEILAEHKHGAHDLLEIGCAHGGFLYHCQTRGITNVVGVEVDASTCALAVSQFGLEHVVAGLFPDVSLPYDAFDAVVGFDVLEHFIDPVRALQRIHDLLRENGVCILQTPCYRNDGEEWAQFRPREHLYLFNQESIRQILLRCRLEAYCCRRGINPDDMFVIARRKEDSVGVLSGLPCRCTDSVSSDPVVPDMSQSVSVRPGVASNKKGGPAPFAVEMSTKESRMKRVSIIIPYHQPLQDLENCLDALNRNMAYPIFEVIVVNDCPPQEHHPGESIRHRASHLRFPVRQVEQKERMGFAHTCNAGADAARGEVLVFLNSDTVPMGGWLEALIAFLERKPSAGVLGSRLLFPGSHTVQHVGGAFDENRMPFHPYLHMPGEMPFAGKDRSLQWVTGASFLVSKKDFTELRGFDARYGSTFEDNDFCFKIRFDLGKEVWLVAGSVLLHRCGGSGLKDYEAYKNRNFRLFLEKWGDRIRTDEPDIYARDGFAPEFLHMLGPLGLSRQFCLISVLLRCLQIEQIDRQQRYVREKGLSGFIADVAANMARDYPMFLMNYPSLFLNVIQREDAIKDISAALSQMSSTELFTILQRGALKPRQRSNLLEILFRKLDAESFFLGMYNLASLLQKEDKSGASREIFEVLAEMTHDVNGEIAGKALYKLAQASEDNGEREEYLRRCLRLYPIHEAARRELEAGRVAGGV